MNKIKDNSSILKKKKNHCSSVSTVSTSSNIATTTTNATTDPRAMPIPLKSLLMPNCAILLMALMRSLCTQQCHRGLHLALVLVYH